MKQSILNWMNDHKRTIAEFVLVLIIICFALYEYESKHQNELAKAMILTAQQATDINSLQNLLDINKRSAEEVAKQIAMAQTGQLAPVTHFTINAPSIPSATQQVQDKINKHDPTLPPSALEKSDRTVVSEQPANTDFPIGVYKINTMKNWEIGLGIGGGKGGVYIPLALQRNYAKDKAIEIELHIQEKEIVRKQIIHKWMF